MLNELTSKLLDEVCTKKYRDGTFLNIVMDFCVLISHVPHSLSMQSLKRESDLYELAKKAEQESRGQPADTDESNIIEATRTPDMFKQPLRCAHTNLNLPL